MKVLILGGGKQPSIKLLNEELQNSDIVICADGGADCLFKLNKIPDYLLGDFDSIHKEVLNFYMNNDCKIENYPVDKDYTDGELCLQKALELKPDKITLLGFTGSRLDHFLGNLGLLLKSMEAGVEAAIIDENNKIFMVNKSFVLKKSSERFFSLQAYSELVENLTIKGAKFPLNDYNLQKGDLRTISNEFLYSPVEINFTKGILIVIIAKD